ncbi:magnesium-dependent phosphatase-1 [Tribonema minus]|uniref:Magnesium-dependent phosphatase-1 n=1 Tax=Tribonema minus TaxID=303371 RepID=A0A836C7Z3_9STRA|nr:magnesium-dependent phosphatase-1 [Tribonema minus]
MFELGGAPKTWDSKTNTVKAGRDTVKLFPGAVVALRELRSEERFKDTLVAAASSTSHRDYAMRCLQMFEVEPGVKMRDVITLKEIYPSSKVKHFRALQAATGLRYDEMLFWDDCNWGNNCAEVERGCPGVVTMKTPDGLTVDKWRQALDKYARTAAARAAQT